MNIDKLDFLKNMPLAIRSCIRSLLVKIERAECSTEVTSILSQIFDLMIENGCESEVPQILLAYQKKFNLLSKDNPEVPNNLFFVWIGSIDLKALRYLPVWRLVTDRVTIWIDSRTKLYGSCKQLLELISRKEEKSLLEVQNDFFEFSCKQPYKDDFDNILMQYVEVKIPDQVGILKESLHQYDENLLSLRKDYLVRDIRECSDLFFIDKLKRFYRYEVVLRNNFAAASDIVRLSLLYKFGGVYIDVDTLPDFTSVFTSNEPLYGDTQASSNVIDIVRTEKLCNKILSREDNHDDKDLIFMYEDYLNRIDKRIIETIHEDISQWDGSLEKYILPRVSKDLILMSGSKNKLHEFNNNMLASHPGSKSVRIILKELVRRYSYMEKENYIFHSGELYGSDSDEYYGRLEKYRLDGFNGGSNVTLILSGPSLLLETILGCSYQILKIKNTISPLAISYALRAPEIGLSVDNQTMFTLEHVKSSWMNV